MPKLKRGESRRETGLAWTRKPVLQSYFLDYEMSDTTGRVFKGEKSSKQDLGHWDQNELTWGTFAIMDA